jgi:hypothetical protein
MSPVLAPGMNGELRIYPRRHGRRHACKFRSTCRVRRGRPIRRANGDQVTTRYLGLRPKRNQSGEHDPQLDITKTGNSYLRRLLTECANYIVGPFGQDGALQRWGGHLASRGGKNARARAITAVARKRAVLLHRLWVTKAEYIPFRGTQASSLVENKLIFLITPFFDDCGPGWAIKGHSEDGSIDSPKGPPKASSSLQLIRMRIQDRWRTKPVITEREDQLYR